MKKLLLALMLLIPVVSNATTTNCAEMRRDETALACTIYYEARGASQIDKLSIAFITINRMKQKKISLVEVVKAPGQYSYMGRHDLVPHEADAWLESKNIAKNMLILAKNSKLYEAADITHGATYYHDRSIKNPWNFTRTLKTSNIIAYKE